ncbi:MAG: hypothetical protein O2973_01375 [Gemmatimonadetes bacterium]|nr:hypothetical protein [Gemmatimonadota bacterium]
MADERPTPPVLARAAMERVLARAAELQAGRDDDGVELTESQLVELASEVGLSRDHVHEALAEERSRIDLAPEAGVAFSLLGPAMIQATRTVPGDANAVLGALDSWMQKNESLQLKRRFPDQLAWEPRQDFVSSIRRALRVGGRGFHLSLVSEVRGNVASVEGKRSHARLVASFSGVRAQRSTMALVIAGAGVVIGVPLFWTANNAGLTLAAALSLVPALAVPALAISLTRRRFAALVARAQVALEQALDRLEFDGLPPRGR